MKKILLSMVGTLLLMPMLVNAENSYVGIHLGQSEYSDVPYFGNQTKTAVAVSYGMPLSEQFDVEFGYVNHGSAEKTIATSLGSLTGKLRTQSLYAAAVGKLPVTGDLSVYGKLGASLNHNEASDSLGDSDSNTKIGPVIGVGLSYQFTKEFSGVIDYSYFDKPSDGPFKLQMWSVGARYHF